MNIWWHDTDLENDIYLINIAWKYVPAPTVNEIEQGQ